MQIAFTGATIFTGAEEITGKALIIENGRISALTDPAAIPAAAKEMDCTGLLIAPGLIDLQIYGGGGYLFSNKPSAEALTAITNSLVKTGTTGFLLTLATNSMEIFREAIRMVKENPHPALLGLHLEGPYINPVKRGAHILEYIKRPEKKEVEALLKEAGGVVKMMTLAPETVTPEIIRLLKENGVVISAGHSNATFAEGVQGFKNGITTATHLFNAMSPLHHRDTGLPGAVFETDKIYASIIADGIHVDFHTLSISKKIMKERLFLITDAVEENREGAYIHIRKKDRFTLPDGTLSGSTLTLLQAVKNCAEHAGIPLSEALRMASTYPAQVIQARDRGRIAPGYKANLTIFNKDLKIKYTCVEGSLIESNPL